MTQQKITQFFSEDHNQKEEQILYPAIDKMTDESDCKRLFAEMDITTAD